MLREKKRVASLFGLAAVIAFSMPALAASPEDTARAALANSPIVDGHNDVPEQVHDRFGNDLTKFDFRDTSGTATADKKAMHTDLTRLKKGMVGGQFWSVYVPAGLSDAESVKQVTEQIDVVERLVARHPQEMMLARTAADIETGFKTHRIASLIGMEGGYSIGSSLGVLRAMYRAGARYMTLTHFKTTNWADSATDDPKFDGLAPFGVSVVKEMNRLGMLVDLSHVSEATMNDALDVATAPVIFSHSGARAIDHHPRDVSDAVLKRLPANGGIVMVVFAPAYVSEAARLYAGDVSAEEKRQGYLHIGDPAGAKAALAAWVKDHPAPHATVAQVADHIDHIRSVAGIDHIGLGSDFDGIDTIPDGLEDVSKYPNLFVELARRGYSQTDLEKISSRNIIRVLRGAEAAAAKMKDVPPGETPVPSEH